MQAAARRGVAPNCAFVHIAEGRVPRRVAAVLVDRIAVLAMYSIVGAAAAASFAPLQLGARAPQAARVHLAARPRTAVRILAVDAGAGPGRCAIRQRKPRCIGAEVALSFQCLGRGTTRARADDRHGAPGV